MFTRLAELIVATPDDEALAAKTGAAVAGVLIDGHVTQPSALAATLTVLDRHPPAVGPDALTALRAGLAAGFADALRQRTRAEQEAIHRASLLAYRSGEARFRTVFSNASLGIGVADRRGRVLEINDRLAEMLGIPAAEARGRDIRTLKQETDSPEYWAAHEDLLAGLRSHYSAEKRFTRPDGGVTWSHLRSNTVLDENGDVQLLISLFEDITDRRTMTEQLMHQATHDPLTGLPNRALLLDRLDALLAAAGPDDRLGICFLDLDGFKGVNDTLGHQAGDRLLATIAHRLAGVVEAGNLVARLGGDEFVILLPHTLGPADVVAVAESVLAEVHKPVRVDGSTLTVTASLGLVERSALGADATELLRAADITLYWAKAAGRAGWALFDEERNAQEVERYALSQALPAAVATGELFLEYQPIVSLTDGRPQVLEALVRWAHPTRGLLGPNQFVPLAEDTGVIVEVGRWVLRRAVAEAATWAAPAGAGEDFAMPAVAVNVAVRQLRDPGFYDDVMTALADAGLPAERLHLEITESALMDADDAGRLALRTLEALTDAGIGIAIDDFGTGYSNLSLLRRLPASTLKIDSSFVADLADDADGSAASVVVSLVTLAHASGLTVTAEGVETADQARRLALLGADAAQGFYFSRPVSGDRVVEVLGRTAAL
jgi:diguanylate cyclase (GGDEF)-like protein/PAS domain S-box-containing protein